MGVVSVWMNRVRSEERLKGLVREDWSLAILRRLDNIVLVVSFCCGLDECWFMDRRGEEE